MKTRSNRLVDCLFAGETRREMWSWILERQTVIDLTTREHSFVEGLMVEVIDSLESRNIDDIDPYIPFMQSSHSRHAVLSGLLKVEP